MESRVAHHLSPNPLIEIVFIHVQKRRSIDFLKNGNVADHRDTAILLDGAAVLDIFFADQRHPANWQPRFTQC